MYVYCIYICIFTCQSASKRNHLKTVFRNVARYLWYLCTYPKSMHKNEMHILMQEACTIMYNNVIQSPQQPHFSQYLLHFLKLASPIFQIVVLDKASQTWEIQVHTYNILVIASLQYVVGIQDYSKGKMNTEEPQLMWHSLYIFG